MKFNLKNDWVELTSLPPFKHTIKAALQHSWHQNKMLEPLSGMYLYIFISIQQLINLKTTDQQIVWNGCSQYQLVFKTNTHFYFSMKYWRKWWHLYRSVYQICWVIFSNKLTFVDVTKLFIFWFFKNKHKTICYAQKADMHCKFCS